MPCIADLLQEKARLNKVSDSAALDIELLLCHCLQKPRSFLRSRPEHYVSPELATQFFHLLARREAGEPVAYLTGKRGFWTLDLDVSPATLIPRPETELLVEKVLECDDLAEKTSVLDLGTGTGAIALALAREKPAWQVVGVDFQPDAVNLSQRNAQQLQLSNVLFQQSDWFSALAGQAFDIIVSNPPYIDPDDKHLKEGDVRFEPISALVSEKKGLADIETIINQAPDYLASSGRLLLEHGYDQGEAVRALMAAQNFSDVITCQDLAGHDRVTAGIKS